MKRRLAAAAVLIAGATAVRLSPFWPKYFFAYLDFADHRAAAPGGLLRAADREAVKSILAKQFSPTGRAYGALIRERSR